MKIALLHIGTRKTGTTSIQNMLANVREFIAPVRYPLMNGDRDKNRLVSLHLPRDKWPVQWHDVRPETVLQTQVAGCIRANHRDDGDFIKLHYGVDLGLTEAQSANLELGDDYRVGDLVESLDPEFVYELLLRLAKSQLGRTPAKRSLARTAASRASRAIRDRS